MDVNTVLNNINVFFNSIYNNFIQFMAPYKADLTLFYNQYGFYTKMGVISLIAILFFILMYKYGAQTLLDSLNTSGDILTQKLLDTMRTGNIELLRYERLIDVLTKKGAFYYFPGLTPVNYVVIKFSGVIGGFIVGLIFNPIFAIILAIIGFFAIDIVINIRNSADNNDMIEDIVNVSDVIILQTSAGVYITQTIIDAYLVAKNERLKSALLELTGNIKKTNDLCHSIELFKKQFDNEHLINIAVALEQAAGTGTSVQMLEDIRKPASNIQSHYFEKEVSSVQRITMGLQIFVFVCIMLILSYGLFVGLQGSLSDLGMF